MTAINNAFAPNRASDNVANGDKAIPRKQAGLYAVVLQVHREYSSDGMCEFHVSRFCGGSKIATSG
jgi:hypothetical protein